jgi:hypothetical protein
MDENLSAENIMKPISFGTKSHSSKFRRKSRDGFALVISLTLMVLLTILSVGLLTLSAVSLRASTQSEAMQVARGNARMALTLAIGQLQKSAGPDQRITAPASLVDESYPPGFTGVWNAWQPGEEGTDYDQKEKRFLGWLTSGAFGTNAPSPTTPPHVPADTAGISLLLGDGTLKDRAAFKGDDARMAVVPTPIQGSALDGRLAWATMDESVKSRVNLSAESDLSSPARELSRAGAPPADGVQGMAGLADFVATDDSVARMITTGSADLGIAKGTLGPLTPDLTVWSASLQTDPVAGGLKRDLSTLFRNGLTAAQKGIRLYDDAKLTTGESDPYLGLLASYHDLYKKIGVSGGGINPGPDGIAASLPSGYNPVAYDARARVNLPKPQATKDPVLVPSILRVDIIFSMITRDVHGGRAAGLRAAGKPYMLHLMHLPVVTLHNPYNVPLAFDSLKLTFKDVPLGFNFTINGQPLSTKLIPLNGMFVQSDGADTTSKDFGITLKSAVGSSSQTLRLLPGQTKLFGTPKVPASWTWADEQPGAGADGTALFDWNMGRNFTSDFQMAPMLISPPTTSCGFDVDWINPRTFQTAAGNTYSGGEGIVALTGNERIGVQFGPVAPAVAGNSFTIESELKTGGRLVKAGALRINYGNATRLKEIVEQGTSLRFPDRRTFPETYPKIPQDPAVTVASLYERNTTPVSQYVNPDPFVIFSISGKTTKESFIPARPYADSSPTVNLAKIDFAAGKDSPGDVPLEMVMMPIRNGSAAIEEIRATQEGFFFGGHGSLNGMPRATFYEIPQIPLQSLAQFRHANLASSGFHPHVTYTVGESLASPLIGTDTVKRVWPSDNSVMLDHTWLANKALWDRYFLSTLVGQTGRAFAGKEKSADDQATEFFAGTGRLLNPRLAPLRPGDTSAAALLDTAEGWRSAAAHLLTHGGFNVNSTSVDAWVAVLSALREADLLTADGPESATSAAFPRVRRPAEGMIDGAPVLTAQRRWQGYRQLTDPQIRDLATRIVGEVRKRGPFLSMSEFVNRRLGPASDERTLRGAVQAAIQQTDLNATLATDGLLLDAANLGIRDLPAPEAAYGPNTVLAPGSLSQGDVLSAIGSHITVRGDTFAIRCYGDATDRKDGRILARAWCEAVVQRVPGFADPADAPEKEAGQLLPTNARFGRRFEVVSFRWLGPGEV